MHTARAPAPPGRACRGALSANALQPNGTSFTSPVIDSFYPHEISAGPSGSGNAVGTELLVTPASAVQTDTQVAWCPGHSQMVGTCFGSRSTPTVRLLNKQGGRETLPRRDPELSEATCRVGTSTGQGPCPRPGSAGCRDEVRGRPGQWCGRGPRCRVRCGEVKLAHLH